MIELATPHNTPVYRCGYMITFLNGHVLLLSERTMTGVVGELVNKVGNHVVGLITWG